MTVNATRAPKAADIQAHARDDLRGVYMLVYTTGTTDATEVSERLGHNVRYARELLGTLGHAGLIVNPDENDSALWTYNVDRFKDRADNDEEAQAMVEEWLTDKLGPIASSKAKATTATQPRKTSSTKPPGGDCMCGCGRATRKLFAPGHDARFAGQVAREIVAMWVADGSRDKGPEELLKKLPSEPLKDKAHAQAIRLFEKASTKNTVSIHAVVDRVSEEFRRDPTNPTVQLGIDPSTPEGFYVYGRVKVGRKWFAARRDQDNMINRANTPIEDSTPVNPLELEYTGSVEGKPASTFKMFGVQP